MKHIVFMMRNYYPYYSAVGICLGNVAEVMVNNGYKITIICEKSNLKEDNIEIYKNQTIIRFVSNSTKIREKLQEKARGSNIFIRYMAKGSFIIYRSFEYIKCILSKNSSQKDLINKYLNALKSIDNPVDILVPSCMPFETIISAIMFKKETPNIEVVPFLFDKFSENGTLHRVNWNKRLKMRNNINLEKKMFEMSERILFTPSWNKHIHKNFISLKEKFIPVEHPLMKEIDNIDLVNYDVNSINIVYTGTVMKSSRNPEPTIKILSKSITNHPEIVIHFYAMGNAIDMIRDFESGKPNNVDFHGQVTTEIAHSAMKNSDILLSIGNVDITQTPSKIFEYMSCCKPIIHIAVYKEDPVLEILKTYPLSCCICLETEEFETQVDKVNKFIDEKINSRIDFVDLKNIYYNAIPEYSAKQILKNNNIVS